MLPLGASTDGSLRVGCSVVLQKLPKICHTKPLPSFPIVNHVLSFLSALGAGFVGHIGSSLGSAALIWVPRSDEIVVVGCKMMFWRKETSESPRSGLLVRFFQSQLRNLLDIF